jgi:hypothetical protein
MTESTVLIANYPMTNLPTTVEESEAQGKEIVVKQMQVVGDLIASAFQDVFNRNINDVKLSSIKRKKAGDVEILMHRGRPFLKLGEMTEEFKTIKGQQHMLIHQHYKVL